MANVNHINFSFSFGIPHHSYLGANGVCNSEWKLPIEKNAYFFSYVFALYCLPWVRFNLVGNILQDEEERWGLAVAPPLIYPIIFSFSDADGLVDHLREIHPLP
jgi:hypothetical protein